MIHLCTMAMICVAASVRLDPPSDTDWKTGARLNKALEKTVMVSWSDAPLRASLLRFSKQQGVAIVLDRRIDPGQIIQKDFGRHSVEETIYQVAEMVDGGACRLGDVFYIGPEVDVANLVLQRDAVMKALNELAESSQETLTHRAPVNWERLARPNQLLLQLVESSGVDLNGEPLPLDLWPSIELPASTLIDRMILLTFGFGLEIKIGVSNNDEPTITLQKSQPIESATYQFRQSLPPEEVKRVRVQYPDCDIDSEPDGFVVTGSPLEIYRIGRLLSKANTRDQDLTGAEVVVSLNTTAQIGSILNKVANNLNLELIYDAEVVSQLKERVQVNVNKASYETLLTKTLESTDLEFEITDTELIIRKKEQ